MDPPAYTTFSEFTHSPTFTPLPTYTTATQTNSQPESSSYLVNVREKSDRWLLLLLFIITFSTLFGNFGIFYFVYTFDEQYIYYIECSVPLDSTNKTNPLESCNDSKNIIGNIGTFEDVYPINFSVEFIFYVWIATAAMFPLTCIYIIKHDLGQEATSTYKFYREHIDYMIYLWTFFTFLLTLLMFMWVVSYTNKDYVCPKIEHTESYLSSDYTLLEKFPNFINITSSECEDMFDHIPRWTFLLPFINIPFILLFYSYDW